MNHTDAGTVGKLQAVALIIAAILFGLAAVIVAVSQFFKA